MNNSPQRQIGASLIEVLITILILSFGMLALSGMLAYAVQMPKLSAYRATAVALASAHVERMRANAEGFKDDLYVQTSNYPQASAPSGTECAYDDCTAATIATADNIATNTALFRQLPSGGMAVACDGNCDLKQGDIWVMWAEPSTFAALGAAASDECPTIASGVTQPRCIHIKFKL